MMINERVRRQIDRLRRDGYSRAIGAASHAVFLDALEDRDDDAVEFLVRSYLETHGRPFEPKEKQDA